MRLMLLSCFMFSCFLGASETDDLLTLIDHQVVNTLEQTQDHPSFKSEEFAGLRPYIADLWKRLIENGVVEQMGPDSEIRGPYVGLQGIVEHVLSSMLNRELFSLVGVIHTPKPATPLCTKGEISPELVDPSIQLDPARAYTVKARATIVRDYLHLGGILYIAYPQKGLGERSAAEQAIYLSEVRHYPNNLVDLPLNCDAIPSELVGATYFFEDQKGERIVFSIRMNQAKDPQERQIAGLWLGKMDDPRIQARVDAVIGFINSNSSRQID